MFSQTEQTIDIVPDVCTQACVNFADASTCRCRGRQMRPVLGSDRLSPLSEDHKTHNSYLRSVPKSSSISRSPSPELPSPLISRPDRGASLFDSECGNGI